MKFSLTLLNPRSVKFVCVVLMQLVAITALTAACGLKGDLVLPDDDVAKNEAAIEVTEVSPEQ